VGQKISVGGVIQKAQKILTKNQQTMYFVTIEDMKGKIELLVFPKVLERIASLWEEEKVIIAEGRLSDKDGAYKLIVDDAKEINQAEIENHLRIEATKARHEKENGDRDSQVSALSSQLSTLDSQISRLIITLPNNAKPEMIQKLSDFFNTCKSGNCKVFLHHQANKLETPFQIEHDSELLEKVKEIVENGNIELS
jgi:DNA polymerase III alpha subunit